MKTKQVLTLLIITLCGCSAIESPSALSITSQQISSNISHSAESVTDTPSVTITSSTQEYDTSNSTFNSSAELSPVSDSKSEEGYYRDDFNVLIPLLPVDTTYTDTNCYELDVNNIIITIKYQLKNNGEKYIRISRYDRLEKREILICNTPSEISGSPNFTAGEGNSFALIDNYCLIIVRNDQIIKTEKFESTGRRVISPDFKLIAHQNVEAHSYSIYNYETGETIINFEKTHSAEPVFTRNGKFIFLDMEYDINVYDIPTGKTDQYEFGKEIWYLRYYENTNTLFLPLYDIDQSNSISVYKLNLETGKLDEYLSIKNLKDGNLNNFDFNQKQFSYSQYSGKGYRIRTIEVYNEYSLVTEREFTAISTIKYCGSGFVVIQSLGHKIVLIYI